MAAKKEVEDDPVINEWDVFITAKLAEQLYLLQFPTRDRQQPYNEDYRNKPLEMRLKPQTGYLEMDVPVYTEINYDTDKAADFGDALAKSKSYGAKGHGVAVGYSHGFGKASAQLARSDDENRLLKHQTLGGQILHDERGKPNYMVGTFLTDKRELHLTALDGVVQMRPQFHHLDAKDSLRTHSARQLRNAGSEAASNQLQHIQTTYVDADHSNSNRTLLINAQREAWKRLRFHDEEVRLPRPVRADFADWYLRSGKHIIASTNDSSSTKNRSNRSCYLRLITKHISMLSACRAWTRKANRESSP